MAANKPKPWLLLLLPLRERLQVPAYGESSSREQTCLLTVEPSVALYSFVRGDAGCRNLQPHCPRLIEKWSLEKRDPKVKSKNGLEENTVKYTEEGSHSVIDVYHS